MSATASKFNTPHLNNMVVVQQLVLGRDRAVASARNLDFGPLPLDDYKFRGDSEDADKWRYMEETVLN